MPHRNRRPFVSAPWRGYCIFRIDAPLPALILRVPQPQLQPMPEVTAQRLQPQPVVPELLPLPPVLPLPQLSQSKQKQHFLLFSLVTPPTLPLL